MDNETLVERLGQDVLKLVLPKDEFDVGGKISPYSSIDRVLEPYDFTSEERRILTPYVAEMCYIYERYLRKGAPRSKFGSRSQRTSEYMITAGMTGILLIFPISSIDIMGLYEMSEVVHGVSLIVPGLTLGVLLEGTLKPMKRIFKHFGDRKSSKVYNDERTRLQAETIEKLNKHYNSRDFLSMPVPNGELH